MRLSELQTGQSGVIIKVLGYGSFRKRVTEMGFVRGQPVDVVMNAPLKDPIVYKIMDYEVSLRRSEASMIEVVTEQQALQMSLDGIDMVSTAAQVASGEHAFEKFIDYSKKRST